MSTRRLLLEKLQNNAKCCEIGVDEGNFSHEILKTKNPTELHLVDPWKYFEDQKYARSRYGGNKGGSQEKMDKKFQHVVNRFSKNNNIIIHRDYSKNVLTTFPDRYFDWIYIDGNHTYDYVYDDLILSSQKVKHGGIIAGDDYLDGKWWGSDIIDAVNDYVNKYNKNFEIIENQFLIHN